MAKKRVAKKGASPVVNWKALQQRGLAFADLPLGAVFSFHPKDTSISAVNTLVWVKVSAHQVRAMQPGNRFRLLTLMRAVDVDAVKGSAHTAARRVRVHAGGIVDESTIEPDSVTLGRL